MSGNTQKPLICWDSCIFLAWFNQEQDKPLPAIEAALRRIVDQKVNLLVSVISYAEVLDAAGKSTAGTEFRGFVKRPNIVLADVDPRVAMTAAEIRSFGLEELKAGRIAQGIKIPDSLIAATAVVYRAKEMYTFDPILLEANGWPVLRGTEILRPEDGEVTPMGF